MQLSPISQAEAQGVQQLAMATSSQAHRHPHPLPQAVGWHVPVSSVPLCDPGRPPGRTGSGLSALQWPPPHSPRSSAVTGSDWLSPSGGSGSQTGPHCSRPHTPVEGKEGTQGVKGLERKLGCGVGQSWGTPEVCGKGDPIHYCPWTQGPRSEPWFHHLLAWGPLWPDQQ